MRIFRDRMPARIRMSAQFLERWPPDLSGSPVIRAGVINQKRSGGVLDLARSEVNHRMIRHLGILPVEEDQVPRTRLADVPRYQTRIPAQKRRSIRKFPSLVATGRRPE